MPSPIEFIGDVHVSPLTVNQLDAAGYKVTRVTDFLPATASDEAIIELAMEKDAVIITQDLDFSALIATKGGTGPSVISLSVGSAKPEFISKLLLRIIPQIKQALLDGAIVSIDEIQFRIRKLPVHS